MQANKFKIPRLAFVNKMDRSGASLETCVESIKQRLNIQPFVMQLPVGSAETFSGVIDLVTMKVRLEPPSLLLTFSTTESYLGR